MTTTEHNTKVIQEFANMMIARMEQLKDGEWKQGWFTNGLAGGSPMNISGRKYTMGNVLMLLLYSQMRGYEVPVFCTIKQINDLGGRVNKGSRAIPAIFYRLSVKDADGKTITEEAYRQMTKEEQKKYVVHPVMHSYNVFNIQQTNLAEVAPEEVEKARSQYYNNRVYDETGMYQNSSIDAMLEAQSWVCPINYKNESRGAFWSISKDEITVPMKAQFRMGKTDDEIYADGQEFYSALIHEMAHSTSTKERLNRPIVASDREKYAREELVAELTAALVGFRLGFASSVIDNNAMYLDGWIKNLREEPKTILAIMRDVTKAAQMICEHIDVHKVEEPTPAEPDIDALMKRQYDEMKERHPGALLLFRCGDFYEAIYEDAPKASEALGITLTTKKDGTPIAGFPHHALDTYLPKLVRAGHRVAICDQLEMPKE